MAQKLPITRIEVTEFEREVRDFGAVETRAIFEPGTVYRRKAYAVRVETASGAVGEYVSGFTAIETAATKLLAPIILGQDALERERIYQQGKRLLRHVGRMGLAPIDIALWDLAGKYYNAPIYQLLGGYRTRLPVYGSTQTGDRNGGLDSPEAYADFAEHCRELGYLAYKIHPWWKAPIDDHVRLVEAVGRRVGGKMDLMLDPACAFDTFGDAVKVGLACDAAGFYWLEDPFEDGGVAHFAHRKLRELIKTPLLQGEHVRGLEDRVNFLLAGATDYIRGDVPLDGITGSMKLAAAAESMGIDVEFHGAGPATRQCMAAIRNSNYLEWGLIHPAVVGRGPDPAYADGYTDGVLEGIGEDGCVPVPDGPGLGVTLNWDYINSHQTGHERYD
jgi:L-alanine-DL-glutamate epimerase-like enolase superfamily enzyme